MFHIFADMALHCGVSKNLAQLSVVFCQLGVHSFFHKLDCHQTTAAKHKIYLISAKLKSHIFINSFPLQRMTMVMTTEWII